MNRARGFRVTSREYVAASKASLLGVVQIETVEAVKKVDEIAAVDGTDVLFVGPLDLSMSLGILGQFDHSDFTKVLELTAAVVRKHGKSTGALMAKPGMFHRFHDLGFRFLACGSDGAMVNNAARAIANTLMASREARR